jgi:hypothetical protein
MQKELPVIKATYDLNLGIIKMSEKLNKALKYSVGSKLLDESLELMTLLYRASTRSDKLPSLDHAKESVQLIRVLIRILVDTKGIEKKKYLELSRRVDNISKQLNGWHKKKISLAKVSGQNSID